MIAPKALKLPFRVGVAVGLLAALLLRTGARGAEAPGAPPETVTGAMVPIPGGTFQMGDADGAADERPVHRETVAPFQMDRTEVTVAAYRACVEAGACRVQKSVEWKDITGEERRRGSRFCNWSKQGRDTHPMNCVDWDQATAFCRWAGKRLPSEVEWEYAARGTDGRRFPWGGQPPGPGLLNACDGECVALGRTQGEAWKAMYPGSDGWPTTAPVGSFPRGGSPFGLLDMAGNVWEWTESPYCGNWAYTTKCVNHLRRVARGGSWSNDRPDSVRAAVRLHLPATVREYFLGFRCARPVR